MLFLMAKTRFAHFCPVARAAELLAERWMPVVVRELLAGSCHFGDLRRGIPLISPATLSQRLHELQDAGILERTCAKDHSRRVQYCLTDAGKELRPIINALGVWGQRWAQEDLRPAEIDPEALSWAMHRRFNLQELPTDHAVLQFELPDVEIRLRRFWFLIGDGEVDVCLKNPGRDADLTLVASIRTLLMVYLGRVAPDAAVRSGAIVLDGSRALARTFPGWCPRSPYASAARTPTIESLEDHRSTAASERLAAASTPGQRR
jgi:DNA-binding HxlR family transcriptional regulator